MNPKHLYITGLLYAAAAATPVWAISEQELTRSLSPQEARIDQVRNQEIHQLQVVLTRSANGEREHDLMLRLAELYTEKYRIYISKETEIYGKKMDAYLAQPAAKQKYSPKPAQDYTASKKWLTKAVEVLKQIPSQKGKYSRLDEVYYFLGFNEWELDHKAQGAAAFQKIVDNYPDSKFYSEANRYIADYEFANREFSKAASHYEKAAKVGSSPARPRILYGLAWTRFKLQDYKGAMNTMRDAIQLGKENAEAAKAGLSLQRDAAESLALFYSEGGKAEDASSYFLGLFGEEDGVSVLRKLSDFYQRQGKYAKALEINKQLLSMGGIAAKQGEEQRFEIMVTSLNLATTRGDHEKQAALLKAMTAEFVTNAKEQDSEKAEILRAQVRKAATLAHREGNKSNSKKEAHQRAEELYRFYLSAFGSKIKSEDAAEIHWYLADVYNQLGRPKDAVSEYRFILDHAEKESAYKKYQKDSSTAIVYAMDGYFKGKSKNEKISKGDSDEVIGSIDTFVKTYPNDKEAPKYLARAAGILVTAGRWDEARPRLMEIIEKYPRTDEAMDSAGTLIKDAETRKDDDAANRLAQSFLANEKLMQQDSKGLLKKSLESLLDRTKFVKTQKLEANKDYAAAAAEFEKTAASAKDPEVKTKALNNAAVNYGRVNDHANELRVYAQILNTYPENPQAHKAYLAAANDHFLAGRYSEAAEVFEQFYDVYKAKLKNVKPATQTDALESLRSAALLRRALKQDDKAAEDFRDIVDAANKGLGAAKDAAGEFLFDVARRQREEGNDTEAVRSFQKYISAFPDGPHVIGANMEVAALYIKLREEEKAQSYYRTTITKAKAKGGKATPEELAYGARARLELLAPLEEAFEKVPLRLPEKQLQADMKAKLAAMERLNKGYVEVMEFGDGQWGVEAFRRMAMVYRNVAQKFEEAPVPEKFTPEDKAKFKAQLKNLAAPIYLKVGETLDTALQKGEQLQVVGPAMARAYVTAAVNSAKPDRMPLIQTPDWSNPSEWIMGDRPEDEAAMEKYRTALRTKPEDAAAWVAVGNRSLLQGQQGLAEIFYLKAVQKNPKNPAALNNLAYLRGKDGDLARAMSGFKAALAGDEFANAPKKNITRLFMGAGLWRHVAQNYRQLDARMPKDLEVKRGTALAALAAGKVAQAESVASVTDAAGDNGKFAEGVLALAKGNREKAAGIFESLADHNELAKLILDFWKTKEAP